MTFDPLCSLSLEAVSRQVASAIKDSAVFLDYADSTRGTDARPGSMDIALIPRAIVRRIIEASRSKTNSDESRNEQVLAVPINIGNKAALANLIADEAGCQVQFSEVGTGQFIFGDDNSTFGKWNSLVAYSPAGEVIDVFEGHGGETIPGKLADHVDRLRNNLIMNESLPIQMDLDVSMACPSNCIFCFSSPYRAVADRSMILATETLFGIIRKASEFGIKVIRFDGGGDPLAHPDLLEAVLLSSKLGMQTAILTAGDLFTERQLQTFVDCCTYVRVSLNSATDENRLLIHQPNNPRHNLSGLLAAVRKLADLRFASYGRNASRQMLIGATSMIHPLNSLETFDIARRAKDAGFDHISFRVILGTDHRVHFSPAMRARVQEGFERIRSELVDDSFLAFFPTRELTDTGYVPREHFSRCLASTHRMLVEVGHHPGVVANVPCGRYRGHGFRWSPENATELVVLGHYGTSSSIEDVWMKPAMKAMVDSFPRRCGDCIDRSANLFFGRITSALSCNKDAQFAKFARMT
jgi:MoaA/NifB/PqqE/SkfB family radical SAM enzyme